MLLLLYLLYQDSGIHLLVEIIHLADRRIGKACIAGYDQDDGYGGDKPAGASRVAAPCG